MIAANTSFKASKHHIIVQQNILGKDMWYFYFVPRNKCVVQY